MKITYKLLAASILIGCAVFAGANRFEDLAAPSARPPASTEQDEAAARQTNITETAAQTSPGSVQYASSAGEKPAYPEKILSGDSFIADGQKYPMRRYKALAAPNDPLANQWWVSQTGMPSAWDYSSGVNTKVAIIDTGFSLGHEELAGRWIGNSGESGPVTVEAAGQLNCTARLLTLDKSCNGLDDDGNGFIDDYRGWDFENEDASVSPGQTNPEGESAWHGTAVAGVAAASANNGVGLAGISWNAKILPLQALDDDGFGNTLTIARAIRYAADSRVDVINLSLGSDEEDAYLRQAIQYALARGVIVVAAAGNDGCNCMSYPAMYPEVVAVGASASDGNPAAFSSYGDSLDIMAPGSNIQTADWVPAAPVSSYAAVSGTSFSAPYVSGLLANARAAQPNASWGQLVNLLTQTADHRTLITTAPRSQSIGFGYVKAGAFMQRIGAPYSQAIRYGFTLDNQDALSAPLGAHCEAGQFPTAPFYEIRQSGSVYYSVSELTALVQSRNGAVVAQKGFICTGLPTDKITLQNRLLSPVQEFANIPVKN